MRASTLVLSLFLLFAETARALDYSELERAEDIEKCLMWAAEIIMAQSMSFLGNSRGETIAALVGPNTSDKKRQAEAEQVYSIVLKNKGRDEFELADEQFGACIVQKKIPLTAKRAPSCHRADTAAQIAFDGKSTGKTKSDTVRDIQMIVTPGSLQAFDPQSLVDRAYATTHNKNTFSILEVIRCGRSET